MFEFLFNQVAYEGNVEDALIYIIKDEESYIYKGEFGINLKIFHALSLISLYIFNNIYIGTFTKNGLAIAEVSLVNNEMSLYESEVSNNAETKLKIPEDSSTLWETLIKYPVNISIL